MATWRRRVGACLACGVLALSATPAARGLAGLPSQLALPVGQQRVLPIDVPRSLGLVTVRANGPTVHVDGRSVWPAWSPVGGHRLSVEPTQAGHYQLRFRLFGIIPLRSMAVDAVPDLEVVPGGQAVGVLFDTSGVLVTGLTSVADARGGQAAPARDAGLQAGDLIVQVDGRPVHDEAGLEAAVQRAGRAGRTADLLVLRAGRRLTLRLSPVLDPRVGRYVIGAWVRDGASGLGTLTFYDPVRRVFGALGHVVAAGGRPFSTAQAALVPAKVAGLQPGRRGDPGEKLGVFGPRPVWGHITENTDVGIFGPLLDRPTGGLYTHPVPIATEDEVRTGPAEMLTVLAGTRVQAFRVEIERLLPQNRPAAKGLLVHVTDPRLLRSTGGIVQGMSGSPILQDGRLVGAVTHVFVNDPTRGYGVLAIWMAEEAGLLPPSNDSRAAAAALPRTATPAA